MIFASIISNMKKQLWSKSSKAKVFGECVCLFLVSIILFFVAIIHYDNETENNTHSFTATVYNVQYHSIGHAKGQYMTFCASDKFYYIDCSRDEYDTIQDLAMNQVDIEITVTKEKEYLRFLWLFGFEQVVEIKDGNTIYIPIERHNSDQMMLKIIFLVLATFLIISDFMYILFIRLIYLKNKRKHKNNL